MAKKAFSTIVMVTLAMSVLLGGFAAGQVDAAAVFSDVGNDHWAIQHIEDLTRRGVFNGYPDGTFKPNNKVTRAEFIKTAVESFNLTEAREIPFRDKGEINASWASDFVARAVGSGLLRPSEYREGLGMNEFITRGEAARITVRALEAVHGSGADGAEADVELSDLPSGEMGDYIVSAARFGVINGYPDGTFRPHNTLTRAEAAKVTDLAIRVEPTKGVEADGSDQDGAEKTGDNEKPETSEWRPWHHDLPPDAPLPDLLEGAVLSIRRNSPGTSPHAPKALHAEWWEDLRQQKLAPATHGGSMFADIRKLEVMGDEAVIPYVQVHKYEHDGQLYADWQIYDMRFKKEGDTWILIEWSHRIEPVEFGDPNEAPSLSDYHREKYLYREKYLR